MDFKSTCTHFNDSTSSDVFLSVLLGTSQTIVDLSAKKVKQERLYHELPFHDISGGHDGTISQH
jgi:hypothetical protein